MDENIIIVNEDGLNNCLAKYSRQARPSIIFPPTVDYYHIKYKYILLKDMKEPEKTENFKSKEELKEYLKNLCVKNDEITDIKKRKTKSNYVLNEYGNIKNWDEKNFLWNLIFTKKLKVPEEHNLILTEGINTSKEEREKMAEIMFETFNIPKLFIAKKISFTFI